MTRETTLDHQASFPLSASVPRAFQALTRRSDLERWFASTVDIEAKLGGTFDFRGKATLGAPKKGETGAKFTRFEKDAVVAFTWKLCGVDTEVEWKLTGTAAESCQLAVRHRVYGTLPFERPHHVIEDLWKLHVGNLMALLLGRDDSILPDYTSADPKVELSIDIDAPREVVFQALIDPEKMKRWIATAAKVDLKKGVYSYGWQYTIEGRQVEGGPQRILELVENEKLVTDWPDWRGLPGAPPTQVAWILESRGKNKTRLTLIHSGFARPVDRSDYQQGWYDFVGNIQKLAQGEEVQNPMCG